VPKIIKVGRHFDKVIIKTILTVFFLLRHGVQCNNTPTYSNRHTQRGEYYQANSVVITILKKKQQAYAILTY